MLISRETFARWVPVSGADSIHRALSAAAARWQIDTLRRQEHWLVQLHHESGGFKRTRENLNYSVDGLLKTFGRHRITEQQARALGRDGDSKADQQGIANILYGGRFGEKNLGNIYPNDGWLYIGRGFKQLTGRENYRRCSLAIYRDERLLETPELLEQPEAAAQSAGWFWNDKGLNTPADEDDLRSVRKTVNGGLLGLDECHGLLSKLRLLTKDVAA